MDKPRWDSATDKLWGVHAGLVIADSRIVLSLGSSSSRIDLTRQGNCFTGGSRFSSIFGFVLFTNLLRLF